MYITGWGLDRLGEIGSSSTGALWPGQDHRYIRPDAALRAYSRHVKSRGLRYIPLNHLRHTHATIALSSGIDLATLSKNLGHSRTSTTADRYLRPLEEAKKKSAGIFATALDVQVGSRK